MEAMKRLFFVQNLHYYHVVKVYLFVANDACSINLYSVDVHFLEEQSMLQLAIDALP
jgi:hypothetical protein